MKIYLTLTVVLVVFAACRSMENSVEAKLNGNWVVPVEGMPNQFSGFTLSKKNIASSINMSDVKYEKWSVENDSTLLLYGQRLTGDVPRELTDTLQVMGITPKDLTVKYKGEIKKYVKK